jgi:undecaprenyl-diphosphatase
MSTRKQVGIGATLMALFLILALGVTHNAAWVQQLYANAALLMKSSGTVNTTIFMAVASMGSPLVAISLSVCLSIGLVLMRRPAMAVWLLGVQFGGSAVAELIKMIVRRARPTGQLVRDTGYSFPSGHTFCTAILVLSVIYVTLPLIADQESKLVLVLAGVIWIGLVAAARVYLRDHFGSDVLGSMLLAGGWWGLLVGLRSQILMFLNNFFNHGLVREGKD